MLRSSAYSMSRNIVLSGKTAGGIAMDRFMKIECSGRDDDGKHERKNGTRLKTERY